MTLVYYIAPPTPPSPTLSHLSPSLPAPPRFLPRVYSWLVCWGLMGRHVPSVRCHTFADRGVARTGYCPSRENTDRCVTEREGGDGMATAYAECTRRLIHALTSVNLSLNYSRCLQALLPTGHVPGPVQRHLVRGGEDNRATELGHQFCGRL